jgi:hypothetical protein
VPCLQAGGYRQNFSPAEDSDFWRRLALLSGWRFANLNEIMLRYRAHSHADRSVYRSLQSKHVAASIKEFLLALGIPENELDTEAHLALFNLFGRPASVSYVKKQAWIERLIHWNLEAKVFDPQMLADKCGQQLLNTYTITPWLPAGLKRLIPSFIKTFVKKIFSKHAIWAA